MLLHLCAGRAVLFRLLPQFNDEPAFPWRWAQGRSTCCFTSSSMLANMGGRLEKLKYATVFTLFDPTGLFRGDGAAYAGAAVLLALGLGFYALGTAVFSRRDLPL